MRLELDLFSWRVPLLTDAKVLWSLLEQRVGHFLDLDLLGHGQRCRGDLLSSDALLGSGLSSLKSKREGLVAIG